MSETAGGVVGGFELVGDDIGVGADDAEEVVDGVGDGVDLVSGETVGG